MASGKHCLFVDTSGWIEVFGVKQDLHKKARDILTQAVELGRPILTSNYVVVEFIGNAEKKCSLNREGLFKAYREIRNLQGIEIVHINEKIHAEELTRLCNWLDKGWSLVDATSFNIMRTRKITDALAKDGHFDEAGFNEMLGKLHT